MTTTRTCSFGILVFLVLELGCFIPFSSGGDTVYNATTNAIEVTIAFSTGDSITYTQGASAFVRHGAIGRGQPPKASTLLSATTARGIKLKIGNDAIKRLRHAIKGKYLDFVIYEAEIGVVPPALRPKLFTSMGAPEFQVAIETNRAAILGFTASFAKNR